MLRIHLFGPLRLEFNDAPHRFAALPKTLPLFAYLLLNRAAPLSRATLAFTLWPDLDEESARSNLRRHLYELRRTLPPVPDDCPWVKADSTTVQWNSAAPYWLDVAAFEDACRTPDRLAEVVELYQSDLLPAIDEEWLIFERERLRTAFLTVLAQLIEQRWAADDYVGAIDAAATLLRHEPLREDIVRTLMSLRADSGDLPGALLEYRRFEQELRRELAAPPTAETSAHYDALARRVVTREVLRQPTEAAPLGDQRATALSSAPTRRHNLPAQLTSFVGRAQELADIRVLLGRSQTPVRMLTLVGPGGSGKTRLALEAAARLLEENIFTDGIFFAPLAALTDPGEVVGVLAAALNVATQDSDALKDRLLAHLQTRRLLLVLDNFEHVDVAAPLIAELLAAAPGLAFLVTSRVALRIYGEQEYPVAPLPLPDLDDLPTYERLAHIPSIELFIIRSRAVNPTYTLRPEDAACIAEICIRLDGLPLAIELAAARSKLYSPAALLARLSNWLAFLENRARDAEQRHQTLRATLDWSYRLLGMAEQKLLARLAVFARSFTAEAAEIVCSDATFDLLDALGALCDHSLLQPTQMERGLRFVMLTTVHDYAGQLLDPADRETLQQRHVAYYEEFARQAGRQLYGAQQMAWLAALRAEEDNLRAALRYSFAAADASRVLHGMRIARGLARFWQISGRIAEGRGWFDQAMAVLDAAPTAEQVEVLGQAGLFAQLQGDHVAALRFQERALTLARTTDDAALLAYALYVLGSSYGRAGDAQHAASLLTECLALRRQLYPGVVTDAQMALTLNNLAVAYVNTGRYAEADLLYTESLAIKHRTDDQFGIAAALVNLGDLALRRKDYDSAARFTRESLELRVALDDQLGMTRTLDQMAELATLRQEYRRAATLFAAATASYIRLQARRNAHVMMEIEAYLASIQAELTPDLYQRAVQSGQRMTLDEAVRFALSVN